MVNSKPYEYELHKYDSVAEEENKIDWFLYEVSSD